MSGGLLALRGLSCSEAGRPTSLLLVASGGYPLRSTLRLLSYGRCQHKVG